MLNVKQLFDHHALAGMMTTLLHPAHQAVVVHGMTHPHALAHAALAGMMTAALAIVAPAGPALVQATAAQAGQIAQAHLAIAAQAGTNGVH